VRVVAVDPAERARVERALAGVEGPAVVTTDPARVATLRAAHPRTAIVALVRHRSQIAAALDDGADAAMLAPPRPAELRARLRRLHARAAPAGRLRAGPLELDPRARAAWLDRAPLELSRRELALLCALAAAPGEALTKEALLRSCWGGVALAPSSRTLDRHVSRLRARLGRHAPMLVTVWGVGYRLDEPA